MEMAVHRDFLQKLSVVTVPNSDLALYVPFDQISPVSAGQIPSPSSAHRLERRGGERIFCIGIEALAWDAPRESRDCRGSHPQKHTPASAQPLTSHASRLEYN